MARGVYLNRELVGISWMRARGGMGAAKFVT